MRSPLFLGRLLVALVAIAGLAATWAALDRTGRGLQTDLEQVASRLSPDVGPALDAITLTLVVLAIGAGVARELARRHVRYAVTIVVGAALAFGVTALAIDLLGESWTTAEVTVVAGLSAGMAVLTLLDERPRPTWLRAARWMLVVPALAAAAWSPETVVARGLALLGGVAVGAAVALIAGSPSRRATPSEVAAALRELGAPVVAIWPAPGDARGSVPYLVELDSGTRLFVKAHSTDQRIADLLFRLWRVVRLREPGPTRPDSSLLRAVEHEAFVAQRAATVGVRTPRVISLGALERGGAYAAYEMVDGRTLAELGESVGDATLRESWSMVQILHRAGIAHRDLRAANLLVDDGGDVWIVDFGFAELVGDEEARRIDRVELLASTAAEVGVERAVENAVAVLGPAAWDDTLAYVQPLAVSAATREALGRSGFAELRARLADAIRAPKVHLPRLARVDLGTVASLFVLGIAVWVLLPQLSESGELWERVGEADLLWMVVAVLVSLLSYVAASLAIKGASAHEVPLVPAVGAQLASSFANRITPAKAGGPAVNVRWLVKEGADTTTATTAVGVNAFAGVGVHVLLSVFVVLWAGRVGLGDLGLPPGRVLLAGVVVLVATVGVTFAIPRLRRLVRHRVVPRVRQSKDAMVHVVRDPRHLVLLVGGSVGVTVCYIAVLALSLHAFGVAVAISSVALVYMAGSALASTAPTPGGLGATEAVLAAGLTAVGVAQTEAVAGVLAFRFVTFWLPIIPGWIAWTVLQRTGKL